MTELNYLDITKASDGHIRVPSIGLTSPAITESIAKTELASFSDGAEGIPVKSLLADIDPVQTGSGDPSPSNVRPITGWTGMNVVRTGKNLLNTEDMVAGILNASGAVDVQGVTIGAKTKTSITCTSSSTWRGITSDYIAVTAGGHYYLSLTETVSYVLYAWYDANKTFISRASYNGSSMQSVTAPNNAAFVRYTLQESTAGTFTYHNIQLESGSSATTFEGYNGTTYPISWADEAGTVYGGTLDVTTGLLTVTDANIASYAGEALPSTWMSDRDVYAVGTTPTTGAQVVYKLATPQTYQLTPQAVMTILGQNNIWADTGDVEVAYCADTKMYIDKVIAAL